MSPVEEVVRGFRFASTWALPAPPERVYAVLADVERYAVWWPQIRNVIPSSEDRGLATVRSVLPYTLHLVLHRALEDPGSGRLRVELDGDLHGWCGFDVGPGAGGTAVARFTQEVDVTGRAMRVIAALSRPLLVANHEVMMRGGERGLRRHLAG